MRAALKRRKYLAQLRTSQNRVQQPLVKPTGNGRAVYYPGSKFRLCRIELRDHNGNKVI